MRIALSIAALTILSGCASTYSGIYYSSCYTYHQPSSSIELKNDNSFEYRFLYNDDFTRGTWTHSGDTIILYSKRFLSGTEAEQLTPVYRFSYGENSDKFLFSRRTLVPIAKRNPINNCFLIRN